MSGAIGEDGEWRKDQTAVARVGWEEKPKASRYCLESKPDQVGHEGQISRTGGDRTVCVSSNKRRATHHRDRPLIQSPPLFPLLPTHPPPNPLHLLKPSSPRISSHQTPPRPHTKRLFFPIPLPHRLMHLPHRFQMQPPRPIPLLHLLFGMRPPVRKNLRLVRDEEGGIDLDEKANGLDVPKGKLEALCAGEEPDQRVRSGWAAG